MGLSLPCVWSAPGFRARDTEWVPALVPIPVPVDPAYGRGGYGGYGNGGGYNGGYGRGGYY